VGTSVELRKLGPESFLTSQDLNNEEYFVEKDTHIPELRNRAS